ncbi:MAG: hypothetical protein GC129_02190 [Proteobacteria bacterium]|nr:hypothetical protein [Pseudomonadota bacterium]
MGVQVKPSVRELVELRRRDKSEPGVRKDPWKLAVVAEDGAMLWVVAAGILSRLEEHGVFPDMVVGTSGGGEAVVYYAAQQTRSCSAKVLTHLSHRGFDGDGRSRRFIDTKRLMTREPVMDLEGMVDVVFSQRAPVDFDGLRRGHPHLPDRDAAAR